MTTAAARRSQSAFRLHPQLTADTTEVTRLGLCRVRLMNDRALPWLVLVPQRAGLRELYQLTRAERTQLVEELALASEVLAALFRPDKINIGALGNRVPQLHWHVVARFRADRAWPNPIWGTGQSMPYGAAERRRILHRLRSALQARWP